MKAGRSLMLAACLLAALPAFAAAAGRVAAERGPAERGPAHLTRQQFIGAWRLVRIEYSDPRGPRDDPFYQAGSVGILLYDASGRMSCQIAAPHRPASEIPAVRAAGAETGTPGALRRKAAAFDSYYAYFGTWDFDAATSVVTHHVEASLIPAEAGLNYSQGVTLEGDRLIFTVRDATPGNETLRTKVWERLKGTAP